jgi:hypothetical protein
MNTSVQRTNFQNCIKFLFKAHISTSAHIVNTHQLVVFILVTSFALRMFVFKIVHRNIKIFEHQRSNFHIKANFPQNPCFRAFFGNISVPNDMKTPKNVINGKSGLCVTHSKSPNAKKRVLELSSLLFTSFSS